MKKKWSEVIYNQNKEGNHVLNCWDITIRLTWYRKKKSTMKKLTPENISTILL